MGTLADGAGRRVLLKPYMVVGRARQSDLVLADPRVSGTHAAVRWSGDRWTVRDLGSRNGTWVDGTRLAPGEERALAERAQVGFGAHGGWVLADAGPPRAHAVCADAVVTADDDDAFGLPADDPSAWIYRTGTAWRVEQGGDVRDVRDGATLEVAGEEWTLILPEPIGSTLAHGAGPTPLDAVRLRFIVSRDEEHVELEVVRAAATKRFAHRAHHYLLLTLARIRRDEEARGVAADDAGWIYQDELARQLGLATNGLYQQIHRARRQLRQAGVADGERIVERRTGSGQLRLGTADVEEG